MSCSNQAFLLILNTVCPDLRSWPQPMGGLAYKIAVCRFSIFYLSGETWLSRGKLPSRSGFVGDGSFRGCPVCAHLPPHFLEYTYIVCTPSTVTLTSKIKHSRQGPVPHGHLYGTLPKCQSYSILVSHLYLLPL
jgi:hypothetical protein